MGKQLNRPRIGIYVGAFDPVHAGHISFALQAMREASLDQVVFMPERRPYGQPGVEHFAHRVAMLKAALKPYQNLAVMEMVDRHFTVSRTLPLLNAVFPTAQLVFLMGSDMAATVPQWTHADRLMQTSELVIGTVDRQDIAGIKAAMTSWPFALARQVTVIESYAPEVSSSRIRAALRHGGAARGLLTSVRKYARQEWLYVTPALAVRT